MNAVLRAISTMSLLLLLAACGGNADASKSAAVPADRPMQEAMSTCVGIWMDEVAGVSSVRKTLGNPGTMSRVQLEECGNARIASRGIAAGFACNPDGCYATDKHGFDWTDAAREWACDNSRPEVCDLKE
ncbi:hypothetical protein [Nocardioides sp.]|uniref:hypothetical protein n=1 Tax=Nocardioides sp. TaxID=35761 RepID=UPI002D07B7BA|nr:hypothetical protein [Nocardioides sp.]HXH78848.1 hypothetical protein [Nocardioides sp.]